jgi:hypothetical protein
MVKAGKEETGETRAPDPRRMVYDCYPIPTESPLDFQADQILVREIVWSQSQDNHYRWIDRPKSFASDASLRSLVRRIATSDNWHDESDYEERHVLDIPVYRDSYIVLKMGQPYQSFMEPGVCLNTESAFYGGLKYVSDDGTISSNWPSARACKVIYFEALARTGTSTRPYTQGITYHPTGGSRGVRPIDPDIRYPGNGGQ